MAWDDPVVWILIIAVVVFLFGASKIPSLARSIGQARREFNKGFKGEPPDQGAAVSVKSSDSTVPVVSSESSTNLPADDPLMAAAQKEGIQTQGKTREQIASELSWKLNRK